MEKSNFEKFKNGPKRFLFSITFLNGEKELEKESFVKIHHDFTVSLQKDLMQFIIKRKKGYKLPNFDNIKVILYTMFGDIIETWHLKETKKQYFEKIKTVDEELNEYRFGVKYREAIYIK